MNFRKILILSLTLIFIFCINIEASLDYKPVNVKGEIFEDDSNFIKIYWDNPENVINDISNGIISNVKLVIDYKIDSGKFTSELNRELISVNYNKKELLFSPFNEFPNADAFNSKVTVNMYYTYNKNGQLIKSKSIEKVTLGHESSVHGGKIWSKNNIQLANSLNIIPENVKEDISAPATRQEFIKILMNLDSHIAKHDVNTVYQFSDTNDIDVTRAYNIGIVEGESSGLFRPNDFLTREQMSTIINRYLVLIGKISDGDIGVPTLFDFDKIAPWAQKSIINLLTLGIIKGDENGMINPKQNVTREQAIVMIIRILDI